MSRLEQNGKAGRNAPNNELPVILPASIHILNAARELFAEFGYADTTVRMIARKARVNNAAISYYYRSKEQLYEEVFKSSFASIDLGLDGIVESVDDTASWRAAVDAWVGRILFLFLSQDDPELVTLRRLVVYERSNPTPHCAVLLDGFFMPVISVLRKLIDIAAPDRSVLERHAMFVSFLGQCTCFLAHEKPWDRVLFPPDLTTAEWMEMMRKQITGNILARLEYKN